MLCAGKIRYLASIQSFMIADIKSEDKLSYPCGLLTYNASKKNFLVGIKFKTLSSGNTEEIKEEKKR